MSAFAEFRKHDWRSFEERQALVSAMSDEALCECVEGSLPGFFHSDTEALQSLFAPELLRRLKAATLNSEENAKKWQEYEKNYILPCFTWAKESGLDLEAAVRDNPGHNCVELLVRWLQTHVSAVRDYAGAIDSVREAVGYKYTQHYLSIAADLKTLVEAIESRCDAMTVLKRIRGDAPRQKEEPSEPKPLNFSELTQACRNIGFDLTCGACASLFYTGFGGYGHDETCKSHSSAGSMPSSKPNPSPN